MRWLPGPFRKIFRHWEKLQRFVRGVIAKHKENLDQSDLGDYIDCYLKEIEKVRGKYLRPLKAWSPKRADKTQGNFVRRAFSFLTSFMSDFLAAAGVWSLWKHIDFYIFFFHLEAFKLYLLFLILSTGIGGLSGNLFMFLWEFAGGCFGFGLGFWKHPLPNKHFYCLFFLCKFKDDTDSYFHEENLLCSTLDLFLTGTETTATAIRWALLYMAVYPHIQGRATDGSFIT